MDPYEKTAQEMGRQSRGPARIAKGIAGAAATAATIAGPGRAFAPMLARAAPFLSEYIPQDLAMKGLSKISPKLGKFVSDALKSGFDFDEAKKFLGEQITESQAAKQEKNIIEQVSPELHQFISDQIKQGREGYAAGAIAQKDKRFAPVIEKLIKEHKMSWADIIEQIYGQGAPLNKKGTMQQEADRFEQQYGGQQQPPQGPQQPGPGQQAIMGILTKISQKLGP